MNKKTFDTDVRLGDQKLLKGTYALYAFPKEKEWQIVFHKILGIGEMGELLMMKRAMP
ncbi:DUF2911 domain-containing protein [Maribacter sp. ACAM166]|nr:DUF2911 domain-containing protein [Maribacter sp. ACAM166]